MSLDIDSCGPIVKQCADNLLENDNLVVATDAFRFLRNTCASSEVRQSEVGNKLDILKNTRIILHRLIEKETLDKNEALCLAVGLQFLGNFSVNNKKNQLTVWSVYSDTLEKCLTFKDEKVQNCTLMIFYNILLGNPQLLDQLSHPFERIVQLTLSDNPSEYAGFIVELFVTHADYIKKFYNEVTVESRLVLLEEIQRLGKEENSHLNIPITVLDVLAKEFSKKADWVLNRFNEDNDGLKVLEVVKTLDALVTFSSGQGNKKQYFEFLQMQTSLYIDLVALLKAVHMLSKENGNKFTMATRLSDCENLNNDCNPVFGFKATLIRIIGNLSWKNKKLQDIVRDLEGIQVILDCCIIDGKNPFIMQWSILAIRNICENNLENQQIIAQMSKEGSINAQSLQELGITLNSGSDNSNTISIAPLKVNK